MTLFSAYPCYECSGPVELVSGQCERCGRLHREAQPGPQAAFVAADADVVLYGGAAGGGKSYGLELDALMRGHARPGWSGVLIRRESRDIFDAGGLWDKAHVVFKGSGSNGQDPRFRQSPHGDVSWPSGARLTFKHLKSDQDLDSFQGPEYAWIGIDEATHLKMRWILYLVTRNRTTCGAKAVLRMTCNPDCDHELRDWVDWYLDDAGYPVPSRSGVVRHWQVEAGSGRVKFGGTRAEAALLTGRPERDIKTFAFIPSLLEDNPALLSYSPQYSANLAVFHGQEAALRGGCWNEPPELDGMVSWNKWQPIAQPIAPIVRRVRGWDAAYTAATPSTNPDFTAGPMLEWDALGNFYLSGLAIGREDPPGVLTLQRATATLDGRAVTQSCYTDPAAGKMAAMAAEQNFKASPRCGRVVFRPTGSRAKQKIANATPLAEGLKQGRGYLLVGDWLDEPYLDGGNAPRTIKALIRSQLTPFPDPEDRAKDDIVDGLSAAFNEGDRGITNIQASGSVRETTAAAGKMLAQRLRQRGGRGYRG